jgi:hypothetical protein
MMPLEFTVTDGKKFLKGSPSRDIFKFMHKQQCKEHWGCDLDFIWVMKYPQPDIVAGLDYKTECDEVTFSEVIAYNALLFRGISIYIVVGDAESGCFDVYEYIGGHHSRPRYTLEFICKTNSWREFHQWQAEIRKSFAKRFSSEGQTHGR